jgi:hypothetical protein
VDELRDSGHAHVEAEEVVLEQEVDHVRISGVHERQHRDLPRRHPRLPVAVARPHHPDAVAGHPLPPRHALRPIEFQRVDRHHGFLHGVDAPADHLHEQQLALAHGHHAVALDGRRIRHLEATVCYRARGLDVAERRFVLEGVAAKEPPHEVHPPEFPVVGNHVVGGPMPAPEVHGGATELPLDPLVAARAEGEEGGGVVGAAVEAELRDHVIRAAGARAGDEADVLNVGDGGIAEEGAVRNARGGADVRVAAGVGVGGDEAARDEEGALGVRVEVEADEGPLGDVDEDAGVGVDGDDIGVLIGVVVVGLGVEAHGHGEGGDARRHGELDGDLPGLVDRVVLHAGDPAQDHPRRRRLGRRGLWQIHRFLCLIRVSRKREKLMGFVLEREKDFWREKWLGFVMIWQLRRWAFQGYSVRHKIAALW